jgi:dipeptidyl aminopeptidase/acylaminoacyl peptidase
MPRLGIQIATIAILFLVAPAAAQEVPSIRDVLSLETNGSPSISPDGRLVLYRTYASDWENDARPSTLWISIDGGAVRQLELPGLRGGFEFCGERIAYLVTENEARFLRRATPDGEFEDAGPLPDRVRSFSCSSDEGLLALAISEAPDSLGRRAVELFGPHDIKDQGWTNAHLWVGDLTADSLQFRRLTEGDFTVGSYSFSPDGRRLAYDHSPDPRSNSSYSADISMVNVESGETRVVANNAGWDRGPIWSPDGSELLYESALDVAVSNLPGELLIVPADGGEARLVTESLATDPRVFAWNDLGIWLTADEGTLRHVYRLDPRNGALGRVGGLPEIVRSAVMDDEGTKLALLGESRASMPEVMVTAVPAIRTVVQLTDATAQVADWPLGTREVIQWQASDGLGIEGVLWLPENFDATASYPLMVVVHGGPRAVDRPTLVARTLYPVEQWISRGAVVLMPNYRGSVGYGPEFRTAHHRTVGPGDAMDVLAGVEHLIDRGFIDSTKVAVMGWSYGGFISAYLTATSDRFAAISVGAGITDWPTHYAWEPANITTKIFSFGVAPYEDPEAWSEASPMTHIAGASTPTLIQHVDGDPIVTVLNAYELYQALLDLGVEARFVEYSGRGHGPSGLKARLGVLWHNLEWFGRQLWNEDVPLPDK